MNSTSRAIAGSGLLLAIVTGCNTPGHQDQPPISETMTGNYKAVAACVFDGVEKQWGRGARFMDLEALSRARVWHEEAVGFVSVQTLRRFEINLSQKGENEVQVDVAHAAVVWGSEFYMGRLRPIFQKCDGAQAASTPKPESLKGKL